MYRFKLTAGRHIDADGTAHNGGTVLRTTEDLADKWGANKFQPYTGTDGGVWCPTRPGNTDPNATTDEAPEVVTSAPQAAQTVPATVAATTTPAIVLKEGETDEDVTAKFPQAVELSVRVLHGATGYNVFDPGDMHSPINEAPLTSQAKVKAWVAVYATQ